MKGIESIKKMLSEYHIKETQGLNENINKNTCDKTNETNERYILIINTKEIETLLDYGGLTK